MFDKAEEVNKQSKQLELFPHGRVPSNSPTKREIKHMKPSNMFTDITEEKFNQMEAAKNFYRLELQEQMKSAKMKSEYEKQIRIQLEIEEERKILQEIASLNQAASPSKQVALSQARKKTV